MKRYIAIEPDDTRASEPTFYTERSWAAEAIQRFERGEQELPDGNYAQGLSVCDDPIAIVYR